MGLDPRAGAANSEEMETALIVGASGGIGSAMVKALVDRGAAVTTLSRREDGLDITDEASVERAFARLSGPFDLVFVATGALEIDGATPEKSIKEINAKAMASGTKARATVSPDNISVR